MTKKKITPNATGTWAAETELEKLRCFEVVVDATGTRVLSKNWRTVAEVEESYKIKQWYGLVTPTLFKE